MFRKFLASALSVLLSLGSVTAALPTAAAADTAAAETYELAALPTGDLEQLRAYEIAPEDAPFAEADGLRLSAATQSADTGISEADPLFAQTSTSYGYEDLALRNNGAARQKLYRDLLKVCEDFWNSTADVSSTEITLHYTDGTTGTAVYYPLASINVYSYKMTIADVDETFFTFRHDYPLFYFCSGTVYRSQMDDYAYAVTPTVDADYAKGSTRKSLQSKITTFINSYSSVASKKTKYEIADAIRTKLNAAMEYAYQSDGKTPEDSAWAHCIIGAITKGKGVCESYAKTYQMLCNYYGVECILVVGRANGGNHAWNVIKLDNGKYYYADITWNDVRPTQYFAWGSTSMNADHTAFLPTSTGEYFLYQLPSIPAANFSTTNLSQYSHTHSYGNASYYNADYHRQLCSCGYYTYSAHTKAAAVRENDTPATCTRSGSYDSVIYCAGCGVELSRTSVTVPATNHTPGPEVKENEVQPTCTTDGSYDSVIYCVNCGILLRRTTVSVPALGHDWDDGTVTTEPSCTEKGEKTYTCSRCEETKTETIPALGHDWDDGTVTTEPTCTEKGEKSYSCSRCEETKTEVVDALGHDWDAGTVTIDPNCTEAGEKLFSCSRCEETKTEVVDALGHDWDAGTVTIDPKCTEAGEKLFSCSRCEETKTEVVEALGHDYISVVTPPTCTEGGYTTHTCSRCGDSYTDTETAPLGHSYTSTVVEPTLEAEGYTHHTCTRCGDTYDDTVVPKLININSTTIKLAYTAFTYTGSQIDVAKYVTITYNGKTLVKGTDYELSYQNGVAVGYKTCTLTITGMGLYDGAVDKALTIKPVKLAAPTLSTKNSAIVVNWKKVTSDALAYQVIYDKVADFDTSAAGHTDDYHTTTITDLNTLTKTLSAYTKPGETWYVKVRAFITSNNTVTGTRYGTFSSAKKIVVKGNVSTASIPSASYTYTGSAIKPSVTVKDTKGTKLTTSDYTVTYKNNTKVGTATITITGKGNYQGTITKTFVIKPKAGTLTLTAGTASFKASWTKDTAATGYQITYSKSKTFASGVTNYNVSKNTTVSANFSSKPKSGETWYVKYRPYVTINGTKYYGSYSAVKSVKTK